MLKHILILLGEVVCLLNIYLWPVNKYEWMYLESNHKMLPIDNNQGFYPLFAIMPLTLLAVVFFIGRKKISNGHFIVFFMLLLAWGFKYHTILF